MMPTTPRPDAPDAGPDRDPTPNRGGLNEELGDLDPADTEEEEQDDGHLPGHLGGGLAGG